MEYADGGFASEEFPSNWMEVEDGRLFILSLEYLTMRVKRSGELNTDINKCSQFGGSCGCYYSFEFI